MPDENSAPRPERRARDVAVPYAPRTPEETGIPFLFLVELLTKVLFLRGQLRLAELVAHVRLTVSVIEALLTFMRAEKTCETVRRGTTGTDADLCYQLTELGRNRGSQYILQNAYAGPCPVTLEAYTAQVALQSVEGMQVTRSDLDTEFADLVVNPKVLEQLGAAMNSGRAIFVHGPAGSGKTYLAERLRGLLKGAVLVPYAIMVDREVLPFYDSLVHELLPEEDAVPSLDRRAVPDARWVRVKRPAVLVGGELTMPMLDLQFDQGSRLYHAPTHLKANNGIFIIDDLGRQRCSAVELMNRWIVPMDRREDFLSLHTGYKFPVPFDMIIVFSSNFAPDQLADGAFLRRLGYKIHVGEVTVEQYEKIFRDVCARYGIAFDQASFQYLIEEHHTKEARPLLACYPRDLLAQVRDVARYYDREPKLNPGGLAWAWKNYFTTHADTPAAVAAPVAAAQASGLFYERRSRPNQ
jgi:hypothetical protein